MPMTKRRIRVLAVSFLAAAFAVTAGFAVQGHARAARYRLLADNSYRHAFTELVTAVGELDSALQKGTYASTSSLFSSLCTQAYGKALAAQTAIGELPYGSVELEQTAAFLAKAGDYAMALSRGAWQNEVCTAEERETLRGLSAAAGELYATLQALESELYAGTVEAEGIREDCVWQLNLGLEQLGAVMLGGGEAEVKAQLTVELLVFQPMQEEVVTSVQTQPFDLKRWEQQPGIVGYIVQPGDSLWKIAKKFHTTVDQVREMNEIDGEEAGAGARLLLIKEVTAGNCS